MIKGTKKQFASYVRIQREGKYNMVTDQFWACDAARLSFDIYIDIIRNYSEYMRTYPEVRA